MKQSIIWVFIAVLLISIALLIFFPGKDATGLAIISTQKSFEIKDRCGPIMNYISHTIQDKDACETRCKSQCKTMELNYKKIVFTEEEVGCNQCVCYCKTSLFK